LLLADSLCWIGGALLAIKGEDGGIAISLSGRRKKLLEAEVFTGVLPMVPKGEAALKSRIAFLPVDGTACPTLEGGITSSE
jgi:hypothetical protein